MRFLPLLAAPLIAACAPAAPAIEVSDAWARATAPGGDAAVYATMANTGGQSDRLVGASTPRGAMAMLHTVDSRGGVARMNPAGAVEIPAGATLRLAPGGTHIMLGRLAAPLAAGESFPLTLTFEKAGAVPVAVTVVAPGDR